MGRAHQDATTGGDSAPVDSAHSPGVLDAVMRNTPMAVFVLDNDQRCVYMNPIAEQMTGFSLPEVQGKALHDEAGRTIRPTSAASTGRFTTTFASRERRSSCTRTATSIRSPTPLGQS